MRQLLVRILRDAGYAVLDAGDGAAALQAAQAHHGPISLLITDVHMPVMAGPELASRFVSAYPKSRILFISGEPAAVTKIKRQPNAEFLRKPFSRKQLLARVGTLLG